MFIPGLLIAFFTFPGVVVHEWAHKTFCNLLGVRVRQVKYFQLKSPAGFVLHDKPQTYKQTFWISVGPLLVNSLLTLLIGYFLNQIDPASELQFPLLWLGVSIGMHAFPSDHDMENILEGSKEALSSRGNMLHYLAFPFVALVWVANKLKFIWSDVIYAIILLSVSGVFWSTGTVSDSNDSTLDSSLVRGDYICSDYFAKQSDLLLPNESIRETLILEEQELLSEGLLLDEKYSNVQQFSSYSSDHIAAYQYRQFVDEYNSALLEYQDHERSYNIKINLYNSQIETYNSYLEEHCRINH